MPLAASEAPLVDALVRLLAGLAPLTFVDARSELQT
jgi:hypothetical protein